MGKVEWWQIAVTVLCVIFSAIFAGLTIGLMSLDIIDLRVLAESGTEVEKKQANRILPVRKHGNFLLCSLLIGNTAVNSALSIVSSSLFGGIVGLIASTVLILAIGEIVPQSVCHRHGLAVGSYAIPLVKFFMLITGIFSYPTSKVLDYFLGGEPATRYNKSQLRSLLSMHGSHRRAGDGGDVEGSAEKDNAEYSEVPAASEFVVRTRSGGLTTATAVRNVGGNVGVVNVPSKEGNSGGSDREPAPVLTPGGRADGDAAALSEIVVSGNAGASGGRVARTPRRRRLNFPWGRGSRREAGGAVGAAGAGGGPGSLDSDGGGGGGSLEALSFDADDADATSGADDDALARIRSRPSRGLGKRDRGERERERELRAAEKERRGKEKDTPLTASEMTLLDGAFQFAQKTVVRVMTPLDRVFTLNADMRLNFDNMMLIFQSGHSRIPVYDGKADCIFGVLFAKDLILLDPEDAVPIRYVLSFFNRTLLLVHDTTPLDEMLNIFKRGGGHLALVQRVTAKGTPEQKHETLGVCTLEDLIEELIGEDIVDETDVYMDNVNRKPVRRIRLVDPEILKMFDHKNGEERLSEKEGKVVAAYLAAHFQAFGPAVVAGHVLLDLLSEAPIVEFAELPMDENDKGFLGAQGVAIEDEEVLEKLDEKGVGVGTAVGDPENSVDGIDADMSSVAKVLRRAETSLASGPAKGGDSSTAPASITVYKRSVATQDAYLVISGRLEITAGDDGFVSEAGPWTLLGMKALTDDLYAPDFTARVAERPARLLRIRRRLYRRMVRYSTGGGEVTGQSVDGQSQASGTPSSAAARDVTVPPAVEVVGVRAKARGRDLAWGELGMREPSTGTLSGAAAGAAVHQPRPSSSEQDNAGADLDA
jgi:CBS domain containing-hemolysin-like protein